MSKTVWVALIGVVLILGGVAACSQVSPPLFVSVPTPQVSQPTSQPVTGTAAPVRVNLTPLPSTISGIVRDAKGQLAGAIVQVKGLPTQTLTSETGTFTLTGMTGQPITVTAWSAGYYVGWITLDTGAPDWDASRVISITLKPLPEKDNHLYPWFSFEGVQGSASCGLCHRENPEWQADAHSQAAKNPRFITVYTGTDVDGRQGQPTQWGSQGKALPPDPNKPYYGPGFQLDTPDRAGNCATCHTPVASKVSNSQNCGWSGCHTGLTIERSNGVIAPHTLPLPSAGAGVEGITCEFCHKIGEVILDPKTKLPLPDMPGILSMRLYRPEEGQQIFFGTLVDVPRRVSYLPLQAKSEFCAPCHYGVFGGVMGAGSVTGGTLIYNSYGEWLDSPYSDPKTGLTCQQCHMPRSSANYFVFPERGGFTRDWAVLHDHRMPGAADEKLLQNAVTLKSAARREGVKLQVEVSVTNDQTGHHIPTDAPIRSMILVIEALDATGQRLSLSQGPANPAWAGNYAGQPGKSFAKVLKDEWTGEAPTTAYWRPVSIVEDTRLAALATDTTQYAFDLPAGQAAQVQVRLVFRRAFQTLSALKGWTDPDILMEEATIQVAK